MFSLYDPLQSRLKEMEGPRPTTNEHPQSFKNSLQDRLYFLKRNLSGKVDWVPRLRSHTDEGFYMRIGYMKVPKHFPNDSHIVLGSNAYGLAKRAGARDVFLGSIYHRHGQIIYAREEIGDFDRKAPWTFVWAGVYAHF